MFPTVHFLLRTNPQWKQKTIFVSVAEKAEKKISIQLYDNKYFYENLNLNFSLQNKQLKQVVEE